MPPARSAYRRWTLITLLLSAALAAAFALDVPVADRIHQTTLQPRLEAHPVLAKMLRLSGDFRFTIGITLLLLLAHWGRAGAWKNPLIVFLAGVFSGVNAFLKWCFGRIRPFHGVAAFHWHPFTDGLHGLVMSEQSRSFPSGDASLAFAMALSLSWAVPPLRWLWWTMAIVVGLERMAALAHYPSDIISGAVVGICSALLARWVVNRLTPKATRDGQ